VNRIPASRRHDGPRCGKCREALFVGAPVELKTGRFHAHVKRSDVPVLIDFWAPWCGPCIAMAPAFAKAASRLEPRYRLAKVNTEEEPEIGATYDIRSIPTMIVFRGGKEIARQAGAMSVDDIVQWVERSV